MAGDTRAKGRSGSSDLLRDPRVEAVVVPEDGVYPNNGVLPLLLYRRALNAELPDLAARVRKLYRENAWGRSWVNGIYDFHHYHSTAHEVLAVCGGRATVQFGGERGVTQEVSAGDVIVIPAGVAHKNLGSSADFTVVGGYPPGQDYDMQYGREGERPQADENIARVAHPHSDPLYGPQGPLPAHWNA